MAIFFITGFQSYMQITKIESYNPNFQAMKANQFKGIDYAVMRKFKAPIETFNTNSNFQDWARVKLQSLMQKEFVNKQNDISLDRKFTINKWKNFLSTKENEWSPAKILLIFSSMVKGLKPSNSTVPPVVREQILENSIQELESILAFNKERPVDFNKIYRKNLKEYFLKNIPENYTGWVVIPSKKFDSKNFEDNVEIIKLISKKTWCTTKTFHAETYLNNGDFHFYYDKGEPKIAIRFSGCMISEIQSEKNNTAIPQEYLQEIKNHVKESRYFLDDIGYLLSLYEREINAQLGNL